MSKNTERLLDGFAPYWERIGCYFQRRPMFVIAILLSAFLLMAGAVVLARTASEVSNVSNAFCNSQKKVFDSQQQRNCRDLLDQLLHDPSEAQKQRIREIAGQK